MTRRFRAQEVELAAANERHMSQFCSVPGCARPGSMSHSHGEADEPVWYCMTHWRNPQLPPEPPLEATVDWRDAERARAETWIADKLRDVPEQDRGRWCREAIQRLARRVRPRTG